jgi:glycosyltransferase involved in cell wall biosynthesis
VTAPKRPRVSVIVPAYNAEPYIRETLDSILAQTYPDVELIVVDDGSIDGTRECILSYGDRVKYVYEENSGGCSKPRNEGIKVASGELLVFIDADDVMVPHRLASQVRFLLQHPHVALVFSNYQDFDRRGVDPVDHFSTCPLLSEMLKALPAGATGLVLDSQDSTEMLLTENFGSSSPMVRREVVEVVGVFDESLKPSEDYDFQYRVASRYPIGLIAEVGWHKRIHEASMSSNHLNILHYKIVTRRRLLEHETVPRRRKKLKQMLATCYSALAYHLTGIDNALALKNALTGLKFRPQPDPRLFGRLLLDALGQRRRSA